MARELKAGDFVRTLTGRTEVLAVEPAPVQPVFNLDVARNCTFFVGSQRELVTTTACRPQSSHRSTPSRPLRRSPGQSRPLRRRAAIVPVPGRQPSRIGTRYPSTIPRCRIRPIGATMMAKVHARPSQGWPWSKRRAGLHFRCHPRNSTRKYRVGPP